MAYPQVRVKPESCSYKRARAEARWPTGVDRVQVVDLKEKKWLVHTKLQALSTTTTF
jgi:hypothetical protein